MKQLSAFLLIIFSVCSLYAEKLRIIEDANLRHDPETKAEIEAVLKAGTIVEGKMFDNCEGWYFIENYYYIYETGWGTTSSDYVSGFVHESLTERLPDSYIIENENNTTTDTSEKKSKGDYFGLFVLFVIVIFIHIKIASTKCPKCNKRFAKVIIDQELLDRKGFYKTVKRTDIRRNRKGEQIGTIEREEQVHMITDYYRVHCKCKYCGYQYDYETSETYEG